MSDAATTSARTSITANPSGGDGSSISIPVIDLSPDRNESDIVTELLGAFTTIGFCTLIRHGISSDLIRKAFRASKNFFELPAEAKLRYRYKNPSSNRGYIAYGAETHDKDKEGRLLVAGTSPDRKETMDIGYDDPYSDHNPIRNEWPQELPRSDFRDILEMYFEEMDALHLQLMKLIGKGLGLPGEGDELVDQCNDKHENLRLLHYPSTARSRSATSPVVRGNAHTDFGTLTLLVQDRVGGLKVRENGGTWIDVQPVEDSIIVNVGDMLMRWSNDRLKATLHKVESPEVKFTESEMSEGSSSSPPSPSVTETIVPERYSIAFFCNANKNVEIKNFFEAEPARYPPINAHDYLTQRLEATIQT